MKFSFLFIFSFLINCCYTQSVQGIIEDEYNKVLFGVSVINQSTKSGVTSDLDGQFKILAKEGDVLKFTYVGLKTTYHKVTIKDTGFLFIYLKNDYTQLKEFVVDGKRIKKLSVEDNDNILDYYSVGKNTFLVLKSNLRNYKLSIEGIDTVYKTYPINDFKPKSLFQDVFGNFHFICKDDSARQFYFDSTLAVVETISNTKFNGSIKPLLYYNDTLVSFFKFSNHNKKYVINYKTSKELRTIFLTHSLKEELVAKSNYNEIISRYFEVTPPMENVILNKSWNGDLMVLASINNDRKLFQQISWYKKIRGREIKVESFAVNNSLLTFNFLSDSLIVQKLNGDIIHKTNLTIANKGFTKKVVLDREQKTFYGYSVNNGVVTLDKINLQTGKTTDSYELNGVTFPENLKVIDGWAYFIKPNKNGYHKLYRIALE